MFTCPPHVLGHQEDTAVSIKGEFLTKSVSTGLRFHV